MRTPAAAESASARPRSLEADGTRSRLRGSVWVRRVRVDHRCGRPHRWRVTLLTAAPSRPESLLRRDHVIVIVLLEVDLHPVHFAAELVAGRPVVRRHWRAGLLADVAGLVSGERHRHGPLDAALADGLAVDVERHAAALGDTAAVVLELHPHLVIPGRDRLRRLDERHVDAEEVVAVLQLAALGVEAPAVDAAALGDDDALGAGLRHVDDRP